MRASGPLDILLVEDDPEDVILIKEAFHGCDGRVRLTVVSDGEQATAYLRRAGEFAQARRPDLILLDLNLPRKSGRDLLADIKADPALLTIPVIVLTTSDSRQDVESAYGLHANCYVAKPMSLDKFAAAARLIVDFWLGLALLPPPSP